jgi:hypothetical protein
MSRATFAHLVQGSDVGPVLEQSLDLVLVHTFDRSEQGSLQSRLFGFRTTHLGKAI